jgi:hypothetical protein
VEQGFVLDADTARARETARLDLAFYLPKASYRRTLRRLGFTADDLSGGGSDELIDDLVACRGAEDIIGRLAGHFRAGATQVAVQPLTPDSPAASSDRRLPMAGFRGLAQVLRCGSDGGEGQAEDVGAQLVGGDADVGSDRGRPDALGPQ